MTTAAHMLAGKELTGGWRVIESIPRGQGATGGNFSAGYIVESESGDKAFLKAIDFSAAFADDDPAVALQTLTEAFNFERDILALCKERRLDRVVIALAEGRVDVEEAPSPSVVQYLIFELADGDIRSQAIQSRRFELAWRSRSLHHISTGLLQLHGSRVAHQDLKPSNVLVFGSNSSKIADVGRASSETRESPFDELPVAGDLNYAPPELRSSFYSPGLCLHRS